jgi:transcriptional regulator with XRE-family HTH domain
VAKPSLSNIGPLLLEKRSGRGIREVAKEIGISPATLSRVENGRLPNLEAFRKICDWLQVDMGGVFGTKDITNEGVPSNLNSISVHLRADKIQTPEVAQALADMIMKAQDMMMHKSGT